MTLRLSHRCASSLTCPRQTALTILLYTIFFVPFCLLAFPVSTSCLSIKQPISYRVSQYLLRLLRFFILFLFFANVSTSQVSTIAVENWTGNNLVLIFFFCSINCFGFTSVLKRVPVTIFLLLLARRTEKTSRRQNLETVLSAKTFPANFRQSQVDAGDSEELAVDAVINGRRRSCSSGLPGSGTSPRKIGRIDYRTLLRDSRVLHWQLPSHRQSWRWFLENTRHNSNKWGLHIPLQFEFIAHESFWVTIATSINVGSSRRSGAAEAKSNARLM